MRTQELTVHRVNFISLTLKWLLQRRRTFKVGEEVLTKTFEKFAPKGYSVTQAPYPVISYKDAMLKYGTDKPDLRNPLEIVDVTEFFQRCTFKPFHGQTVRAIKVHEDISKGKHEKLLKFAQSIGMGGTWLSSCFGG